MSENQIVKIIRRHLSPILLIAGLVIGTGGVFVLVQTQRDARPGGSLLQTPLSSSASPPIASATSTSAPTASSSAVVSGDQAYADSNYTAAADEYQAALATEPNQPEVWIKTGNALREAGNLDDALAAYTKARELDVQSGDSYLNAAAVLWQQNDQEGAITLLQAGIAAGATRRADLEETLSVYEALQQ